MRYLNEIKEGENIVGHYFCKSRQSLKSRAGKTYLSLKLQDKTGVVDAKVWELNNDIKSFEENEFIKIDASAIIYQNEIQLNIKKLRRSEEGEYDPMDYIPSSEKDIDLMLKKFLGYIKDIKDPYIKKLLEEIFIKNETVKKCFPTHTAARNVHHNYRGGLLEHSLSVTEICEFAASHYESVNPDILIASAMLHDVGKIFEISDFPLNDYTDDGELIGHIVIGAELVGTSAGNIDGFPDRLLSLIKHAILSHHGEYEYGSPKLPKTIEAFILHCADEMDAKTKIYEDAVGTSDILGPWVGYQKFMQRNIRRSDY